MVGRALCMLFVRLVGLEGGSRSNDCTSRSGSRRRSFQASLALFSEKLGQHHPPMRFKGQPHCCEEWGIDVVKADSVAR